MNDGKICVSVCAETADELIEKLKQAENSADVIEIRFDCLKSDELNSFLSHFSRKKFARKFLTTFRAKEQGGKNNLTYEQREEFWLHSHVFESTDWADLEEDISIEQLKNLWGTNVFEKFIKSSHDFEGTPTNLSEIYERLKSTKSEVVKIAVQTHDITDTIPIWNLLRRAQSENQKIIPIAMGESGKWTRILGLAHGAFMTYASLDSSNETAPGQISARDLIEVYRVQELDESTEVYGILGSNTSVSLSPYIHNEAFKFHKLNAVFVPLQVQNIDEFMRRMVKLSTREVELNFKGFAITLPHKQTIIKHLDHLDASARAIGAVNTVKIQNGKLFGYNTDAHGFIEPLLNSYGDLQGAKVAVLGAGGAARACVYALKENGAEVTVFARNPEKAENLAQEFGVRADRLQIPNSKLQTYGDFDILVNTTPLGMRGKAESETPAIAEQLQGLHLVYDLIYVPFQTPLMAEADKAEIPKIGGLAMLIAQAVKQQKIWTELDAPLKEMSRTALKKLA